MVSLYRQAALSDHRLARFGRRMYWGARNFHVPAPRALALPALYLFLAFRSAYYFLVRVFICEPLFKAYCTRHGRNLKTGVFVHWVQGRGNLIVGDDVTIDGKCSFSFAVRYEQQATLEIANRCSIGHNCSFTVGRRITIGDDCRIASDVHMFDSPGHPTDPDARRAGEPAKNEEVRPISIGNNVWIGSRSTIYPGVTIGENSVVATGSTVTTNVPPNCVVAGNPARQIRTLTPAPPTPGQERDKSVAN